MNNDHFAIDSAIYKKEGRTIDSQSQRISAAGCISLSQSDNPRTPDKKNG